VSLIPVTICCPIVDTSGKFATGINNTSESGGKFSSGVVDTGGKFAVRVVVTVGEFAKKFITVLMEYFGARGKLSHEKNQKQ
jgi:hypothetical protein